MRGIGLLLPMVKRYVGVVRKKIVLPFDIYFECLQILSLNNGIEKVKQQQQQLDHELDFVLAQQRELEECIVPLEKELKDVPITDQDRNHTYQMAENMDTQLKQMSEDLKEIIEHLNESNKAEDSNDPVSRFHWLFTYISLYLFLRF